MLMRDIPFWSVYHEFKSPEVRHLFWLLLNPFQGVEK
jgi:hypothetical protein